MSRNRDTSNMWTRYVVHYVFAHFTGKNKGHWRSGMAGETHGATCNHVQYALKEAWNGDEWQGKRAKGSGTRGDQGTRKGLDKRRQHERAVRGKEGKGLTGGKRNEGGRAQGTQEGSKWCVNVWCKAIVRVRQGECVECVCVLLKVVVCVLSVWP